MVKRFELEEDLTLMFNVLEQEVIEDAEEGHRGTAPLDRVLSEVQLVTSALNAVSASTPSS